VSVRRAAQVAVALAALVSAAPAQATIELSGVDASAYPTIRLKVLTSTPSAKPPTLRENGRFVNGLLTENLGRTKSVVLAIDRSRSMEGPALAQAIAAARSFVALKPRADRIAIVGFGSRASSLTGFSASTIDADLALRSTAVDTKLGTALYDAVEVGANALRAEPFGGRVIILLTDGRDVSSRATLAQASRAARKARASVFAIAIEGPQFSPEPLRRLARETGGRYRGTSSPTGIRAAYGAIATELRRSWNLEYVTAARPGEKLDLRATVAGLGADGTTIRISGERAFSPRGDEEPSFLSSVFYESAAGTLLLALIVGAIVLAGATFGLHSVRGERLRRRLAPHVAAHTAAEHKNGRERLAAVAGIFRATERMFSHWRQWLWLQRLLERADVPLRTVEFLYLIGGAALLAGVIGALFGAPVAITLTMMIGGGLCPLGFVWLKSRRRLSDFEAQLPDMLIGLAASLKAGHSFKQGLQTVADEGRPPASKELQRVLTEARLGRPIEEALAEMAERLGSKDFEFVITSVTIQGQVGGSLAGLIDMVADTVRQRQQFARKIRSLTAMGRASAWVLMGLPFCIGFAITLMSPEYMDPLFHTSTGHKLIITGIVMMTFGCLALRRIVAFKG
jgi:tight adherence protein B